MVLLRFSGMRLNGDNEVTEITWAIPACHTGQVTGARLTLGLLWLGWGRGVHFGLLFVLALLLRQVRVGIVVAEPRPVLVALPTN